MSSASKKVVAGGVPEYIAAQPTEMQAKLNEIRAAIQTIAPDAIETVSYFGIPGYCYEGYDYNGMFAWFSYQNGYVRLHVRPPVIDDHFDELRVYKKVKSIVSFGADDKIPTALVKKLVLASLAEMRS